MFSLPRGTDDNVDVPLTSAAWENPRAASRLVHRDPEALFIGAMPPVDMWDTLTRLRTQSIEMIRTIDASANAPAERAALVDAVERMWLDAQRAEVLALGYKDDRHFVTIAGARSGKGRSAIVPNLCIYPGSVVVVDPKGENASLTARRRGAGVGSGPGLHQDVMVLDPFGIADVPDELRGSFDPLALLELRSATVADDAALLAEALVVPSGNEAVHWDESAKNLLKGLMLYAVAADPAPTLFLVRRLLTQGDRPGWEAACAADPAHKEKCPTAFFHLLDQMRSVSTGVEELDAVIAGTADTIEQCGEAERGSILSTARRNTAFLDSLGDQFHRTLAGQGRAFDPLSLKTSAKGVSLYLCLPAARMTTHNRWLRIVINMTLERLQRDLTPGASGAPVLFVLDEFFTLGPMPTIENAAGFAAGYGVKLWLILQDLQQLKSMYSKSWQTFLANAGAIQVFGASDAETCEYISKMMGEVATRQTVSSTNRSSQSGYGRRSELDRASPTLSALSSKNMLAATLHAASAATMSDRSESGNASTQSSAGEHINIAPLLRPDEVAQQFSRETGACLLLLKGRRPIWCMRVDYDASPWFTGLFAPLRSRPLNGPARPRLPFGARDTGAFDRVVEAFNHTASKT